MKDILQAGDVDEFAGKFVAFSVTLPSYFGLKDQFPIVGDCGLLFALIPSIKTNWQGGKIGYNMSELLRKDACPSNNALINSKLSKVKMQMRLATEEELNIIRQLVETDEAKFNYRSSKDILPEINEALDELQSNANGGMRPLY